MNTTEIKTNIGNAYINHNSDLKSVSVGGGATKGYLIYSCPNIVEEKSADFIFEIEWEPWNSVAVCKLYR